MSRFLASAAVLAGLAGLLGTPRGVAAHALHPALLDLSEDADGTTSVTWKTSVAQIPGVVLAPRLPASCAVIKPPVRTSDELALVERSVVRCGPGGLVGSEIGIAGLGESKTDALLRVRLVDGRLVQAVLRPDASRYVVPAKPSRLDVLRDYGRLGVSHILTGPDHLLFVLGLLLLAASPAMLLRTITAFTIGHSITLSLAALECGVDTLRSATPYGGMAAIREKSTALTDGFIALVESRCAGHGLTLVTPRETSDRGSQASFAHATGGYPIMQALIARGVIGDFRAPDILRFGFTPLYTRFVDVWDAVAHLEQVMTTDEWREPRFDVRAAVT